MISVVDERSALLASWLGKDTPFSGSCLTVASADASFRRYFRINFEGQNYIVMDAPPDLEDSKPFVQIGEWMRKSGLQVPEIFAKDLEHGFMVLSDFGDFPASRGAPRPKISILRFDCNRKMLKKTMSRGAPRHWMGKNWKKRVFLK